MKTITINKSEYDDFKNLKSQINDIKKNYVSKSELEEIYETLEILNDKNLIKSINDSNNEIKKGNSKKLKNFNELLK